MGTIVKIYKGIKLELNDAVSRVMGEGKYIVVCGDKIFTFNSIQSFKDAVNGESGIVGVRVHCSYKENGEWGSIPIEKFREFVLSNVTINN